jgi:uncharacterized RDD family membrane protein YckC
VPAQAAWDYCEWMQPGIATAYAGFWRRLAAALIDSVVLFIPLSIVLLVFVVAFKLVAGANGNGLAYTILAASPLAQFLVASIYSAVLECSAWQATIGKLTLRLRVTDLEGRRITPGRAIHRSLAKLLSILSLGIGFVVCGFSKRKQALHDIVAGTLVLRRGP